MRTRINTLFFADFWEVRFQFMLNLNSNFTIVTVSNNTRTLKLTLLKGIQPSFILLLLFIIYTYVFPAVTCQNVFVKTFKLCRLRLLYFDPQSVTHDRP